MLAIIFIISKYRVQEIEIRKDVLVAKGLETAGIKITAWLTLTAMILLFSDCRLFEKQDK